jgi:hypothetical protein
MADQRVASCDCIRLTNEALIRDFDCHLPLMISLTGEKPDSVYVQTGWTGAPKRGKKPPKLTCDYCPFCGVKYGWKDADRVDVMERAAS